MTIKNIENLIKNVSTTLKEFTDIVVIGLSGGVDSLVCACLCVEILGKENVYVVHMPYNEIDTDTSNKFNSLSLKVAKKLGVKSLYRPITNIADAIIENIEKDDPAFDLSPTEVNKGNARARARMCKLYDIAHHLETFYKKRVRVIGTGNRSEDYIGYTTKYGDAAGDIFLIGKLYKSEVYQLAEHFAEKGMIEKTFIDLNPSAGLWKGQTDAGELGHTYNEMEPSVRKMLCGVSGWEMLHFEGVDKFVLDKHYANRHKMDAPFVVDIERYENCDDGEWEKKYNEERYKKICVDKKIIQKETCKIG